MFQGFRSLGFNIWETYLITKHLAPRKFCLGCLKP